MTHILINNFLYLAQPLIATLSLFFALLLTLCFRISLFVFETRRGMFINKGSLQLSPSHNLALFPPFSKCLNIYPGIIITKFSQDWTTEEPTKRFSSLQSNPRNETGNCLSGNFNPKQLYTLSVLFVLSVHCKKLNFIYTYVIAKYNKNCKFRMILLFWFTLKLNIRLIFHILRRNVTTKGEI